MTGATGLSRKTEIKKSNLAFCSLISRHDPDNPICDFISFLAIVDHVLLEYIGLPTWVLGKLGIPDDGRNIQPRLF